MTTTEPTQKKKGRPKIHFTDNGLPENETRICVNIDRDIWREFKLYCVHNDRTVKSVLTSLLEKHLAKTKK